MYVFFQLSHFKCYQIGRGVGAGGVSGGGGDLIVFKMACLLTSDNT